MGRGNYVFICPIDHTQEPVLHEGADMKWMTLDEIKNIDIGFFQNDIVEMLEKITKLIGRHI